MRHGPVIGWRRFLCAGMTATILSLTPAFAQSADPPQAFSVDAVKAAYLVNFMRFTEWPDSMNGPGDAPVVIGVAGNRELENYLWKITNGKLLHGRKVRVLRLIVPGDATECHLLYIQHSPSRPASVEVSTDEWLQQVRGKAVLTVSDGSGFLEAGGMINFYTEGNNMRFAIAPDAAEAAGLRLSSRLLALARIVHPSPARHSSP